MNGLKSSCLIDSSHYHTQSLTAFKQQTLNTSCVWWECLLSDVCLFIEYTQSTTKAISGFSANMKTVLSFIYINIRHTVRKLQTIVCNPKTAKSVCTIKYILFCNYLSKARKEYAKPDIFLSEGIKFNATTTSIKTPSLVILKYTLWEYLH